LFLANITICIYANIFSKFSVILQIAQYRELIVNNTSIKKYPSKRNSSVKSRWRVSKERIIAHFVLAVCRVKIFPPPGRRSPRERRGEEIHEQMSRGRFSWLPWIPQSKCACSYGGHRRTGTV